MCGCCRRRSGCTPRHAAPSPGLPRDARIPQGDGEVVDRLSEAEIEPRVVRGIEEEGEADLGCAEMVRQSRPGRPPSSVDRQAFEGVGEVLLAVGIIRTAACQLLAKLGVVLARHQALPGPVSPPKLKVSWPRVSQASARAVRRARSCGSRRPPPGRRRSRIQGPTRSPAAPSSVWIRPIRRWVAASSAAVGSSPRSLRKSR